MRRMNILDQAIHAAKGVSELARALDLEPNVVSNWRKRGIPDAWERVLVLMQRHGDGVFHLTNVTEVGPTLLANSQAV